MMAPLLEQILIALGMGIVGAVIFAGIGLISGSDETTTLAPLTLLVVLLGVPAPGVLTFFLAGAVAKHMTHAVPTALLGIPGDTLATPLMREANFLRNLGVPHIALRKMISGAVIAALIAVPMAVLFAVMLAPFGDAIKRAAPWVFLLAAIIVGGMGTIIGGIVGAAFMTLTPELLRFVVEWLGPWVPNAATLLSPVRTIVFGALIIGFLVFEPQGLAEIIQRVRRFFRLWPFKT